MKTYIVSVITTQLALLTLILLVTKNKSLSKTTKTGIIITSLLIIACDLAELFGVLLNATDPSLRPLHIAVKYFEFSLAPFIPIVASTTFYPIKSKQLVFIPSVLHIVLETLSLFFGFIFYVDPQNVYHHGAAYWLYYLFVGLGTVFLVCTIARFGTQFQNRNNLSLLTILAFVLAGIAFQATDRTVKIVWLAVAIGMILFYIYYCNMVYQIDVLTKLLNRRSYESRKATLKRSAIVLFLDINNFKAVNDSYGHKFGDSCLKITAEAIKAAYGKNGLCYRLGGDEFCVIMDRKISTINVNALHEKFRQELSQKNINGIPMPTVAVGCASFEPGKTTVANAIAQADEQMYTHKKSAK